MSEFADYLTTIGTNPNIISQLSQGLRGWRQGNLPNHLPMVFDQSQIGWNATLEGILGRHWTDEQNIYHSEVSQATSGKKWAHLVIRKLWRIAWDLWEHRNAE
jgi:hypothetical protein